MATDTGTGTGTGQQWWQRPAAVPLAAGALTLVVVLIAAGRRQLWRDEFATLDAARMGLRELYALVQQKDLVLLPYYLGMHFWVRLFGDSEVALRLPSMIAVAIAAALTALQGRMLYGPRVGLLAGVLFGLLPVVTRYGQEARPYGLVIAAVAAAGLFAVMATQRHSRVAWICYALMLVLVGWLHLIALVVLPAHGLLVLLEARRRQSWQPVTWWMGATAAAVAVLSPLVWLAKAQSGQIAWIQPVPVGDLSEWMLELPGAIGVGGVLLGLGILGCVGGGPRVGYLAAWALGPLILLWALTPVMLLFTERYVLFVLPAWCLLAAAGVQVAAQRLSTFTVAVPVLVLLVGLSSHVALRAPVTEFEPDLRGAAAVIDQQRRTGDLVAYTGPFPWWANAGIKYYLQEKPLPEVFQTTEGQATPNYRAWCGGPAKCLDTRARIWLINTKPSTTKLTSFAGMNPEVEKALRARFVVTQVDRFTDVSVSLLTPRPKKG
ncbi:glycosyltransferase family 39 protein [Micromonospora sp. M51]|uniref:glycosyltransferase family 39 protein n=1 Tax=Micromonospora sp. M51 TaxID=2824889 RepID=UPI001B370610|nr:glycosyltransferase family 39 protein [Micromonospora sp. M51]MBQ1014390.1 glycosyltransferase family 39 protein [Micromonospora sp. M51]